MEAALFEDQQTADRVERRAEPSGACFPQLGVPSILVHRAGSARRGLCAHTQVYSRLENFCRIVLKNFEEIFEKD